MGWVRLPEFFCSRAWFMFSLWTVLDREREYERYREKERR